MNSEETGDKKNITEVLSDCFVIYGLPANIISENGSKSIPNELREWFIDIVITSYIEPGSLWENGYCESYNSKMRDEFLNMEVFSKLNEANLLTKQVALS